MTTTRYIEQINDFEAHYQYDTTFMRELLESSLQGFETFNNFLPMAHYREKLPLQDFWIAKIAAMQVEDCGECLQLNVKMAQEAGVSRQIVKACLENGVGLNEALIDLYEFSRLVAKAQVLDARLEQRIAQRYSHEELLELGIAIASAKVFPTIKRAIGYTKSCSLIQVEA